MGAWPSVDGWRGRAPDSSARKWTLPLEGSNCAWSGESSNQAESSAMKANDPKQKISPTMSSEPRIDEEDEENAISTIADQLSPKVGANCRGYESDNDYRGMNGAK